jgi:DNA-binding MarR family transcriptional regulator
VMDMENRKNWLDFVHTRHPDIDPESIQLMDEMRQVCHLLRQMGENSLATSGLSYAKYRLLMGLMISEDYEGKVGLNPSEISERQGTGRNTISALIRDLEVDGFIERSLDLQDRRKFNIRLTPAGREKVGQHSKNHLETIASCFDILDEDEKDYLAGLMGKLRDKAWDMLAQNDKSD